MFRFLKENSYQVVRVFLYQIALSFFGGMLALAGGASGSDLVLAGVSLLSVVFYLYLIFSLFYDNGQKDGIRVDAGRLKDNKIKGFAIAGAASVINFLLGVLTVIFKSLIKDVALGQNLSSLTEEQASALAPKWAASAYEITHTIAKAIQCMYVGIMKVFFSGNVIILLIIPIPAIITAGVAYRLGVRYCKGFSKKKMQAERYKN